MVQISGQPTKPFEAGAASLLAKRLLFETFHVSPTQEGKVLSYLNVLACEDDAHFEACSMQNSLEYPTSMKNKKGHLKKLPAPNFLPKSNK